MIVTHETLKTRQRLINENIQKNPVVIIPKLFKVGDALIILLCGIHSMSTLMNVNVG